MDIIIIIRCESTQRNRAAVTVLHRITENIAKNTGQSFSDLLNGVRIAKAKELLADPALKVWEVSDAVGFADVTHFSRIFKKMENMSANEYRNKQIAR